MSRAHRADTIDLTGRRFGKLAIVERAASKNGARWLCHCDCGRQKIVQGGHLRSGNSLSCGCDKNAAIGRANKTHGDTRTRLYKIWIGMKSRCYDLNHMHFSAYGGSGITVCPAWRFEFSKFREWAMANGYDRNLTIDRIDNGLGYCPENCRWATVTEQNQNWRSTRYIEFQGQRCTLTEWAAIVGISKASLSYRLAHWPIERALSWS